MTVYESFLKAGEYAAAGMYEDESRSLFYRKALGLRRYFENCPLPVYQGKALYPSGKILTDVKISPTYLKGLDVNVASFVSEYPDLFAVLRSDFLRPYTSVPNEHSVAGNMYTHSMPNYERILAEGLLSYLPRIEKIKDTDLRDGLIHLVEGIKTYISRCICYLKDVNADKKLISALSKVPLYPAPDIYEAIVSWNFIMYLDNCDNLGCVASGLLPYYKGEEITELLVNLFDNLNENNGYSMALGRDYNPITLQCLKALKGKRRPMTELFVDEFTPDEIWDKALDAIRSGSGQPAFYNGNVLFPTLSERISSLSEDDIKKFCGGGCTESMIAGLSNVGSLDAGINLLLIFEKTMREKLLSAKSFNSFYNAYIKDVSTVVDSVTKEISASQLRRKEVNPLPMRTLLIDDCIDKGVDFNGGGARYDWSIINFAGLINVIDSMLFIKDVIFDKKEISANKLITLLSENDEELLKKAKTHSLCFGIDHDEANRFSKKLSSDIFSMLDDKKPTMGSAFIPASIQFMSQIEAGSKIGATPDGRCAFSPLADSLGAIFGKDEKGPTALLNSVTSLDLKHAPGVPVLNFNISPDFENSILKSLILGYFDRGGIQMQITCLSKETLSDAYLHPEEYRNLIVRVGGYSEYWGNLSPELRKMIIERTIQKSLK